MYTQLLLVFLFVVGGGFLGYNYMVTNYMQTHPSADRPCLRQLLVLPVVQLGFMLLAFLGLLVFLPDNAGDFFTSDFSQWASNHYLDSDAIASIYKMRKFFGYALIPFGGISAYLLYTLLTRQITFPDISRIKTLSCLSTIYTTIPAWYIISGIVVFVTLDLFGSILMKLGETVFWIFWLVEILATIVGIIIYAVKLQKRFNVALVAFSENRPLPVEAPRPAAPANRTSAASQTTSGEGNRMGIWEKPGSRGPKSPSTSFNFSPILIIVIVLLVLALGLYLIQSSRNHDSDYSSTSASNDSDMVAVEEVPIIEDTIRAEYYSPEDDYYRTRPQHPDQVLDEYERQSQGYDNEPVDINPSYYHYNN